MDVHHATIFDEGSRYVFHVFHRTSNVRDTYYATILDRDSSWYCSNDRNRSDGVGNSAPKNRGTFNYFKERAKDDGEYEARAAGNHSSRRRIDDSD